MSLRAILIIFLTLTACSPKKNNPPTFGIRSQDLKSGFEFLNDETRSLQVDTFSNPGYLWVDQGQQAFKEIGCSECHETTNSDFAQSAAKFPKIHERTNKLENLQGQINLCRTDHQDQSAYAYEAPEMLGLVSYIKNLSLGAHLKYELTPELTPYFETGESYFHQRRGQFNLSCAQCHDENWGNKMRGDTVSQGHINGFPAFRNDWQTLGSAHRRFQACNIGVRAKTSELGSPEYLALEIYLRARGSGLNNETPAIRR